MSTQLEVTKHRLFDQEGLRTANIKLFPGSSRDATSDQMAEQVNKGLAQIEADDYEEVEFND